MSGLEKKQQNIAPENNERIKEENNTLQYFSEGIQNISKEYSRYQEPKSQEVRNLSIKQLQALKTKIISYREDVTSWWKNDEKQRATILNMEGDITNIITLLKEVNHDIILDVIGSNPNSLILPLFLPSEYSENGKIKETKIQEVQSRMIKTNMQAFLDRKTDIIMYFTEKDFIYNTQIITNVLSIPGAIWQAYELFHVVGEQGSLVNNSKFLTTINDILSKEYPNSFGKIPKSADWYYKGGLDFDKIKTILNIINYHDDYDLSSYFVKMMNDADIGNTKSTLSVYEDWFQWTDIGHDIQVYFDESKLISAQKTHTQTILDTLKWSPGIKNSVIYKNMYQHPEGQRMAQDFFSIIPRKDLSVLLSQLSEIETLCKRGDQLSIQKMIDKLDIDPIYKAQFFTGINTIRTLWIIENQDADMKLYNEIENHYYDDESIIEEKRKKIREARDIDKRFSIISLNFPEAKPDILQEKNKRLSNFLNKYIDEKWKIQTTIAAFKEELILIFEGSEIEKKLRWAHGGKEALTILSEIAVQKVENSKKSIQEIDPSFQGDKIHTLNKTDFLNLEKLINSNTESSDAKIQALKKYGITTKDFLSPEEKENYIKLIQSYFTDNTKAKAIQSTLTDTGKWGKLEAFNAYWSGELSTEEFNKTVEKRDQERKKQEEQKPQELEQTKSHSDTDRAYDFNTQVQNNFSKIPIGETITTYMDNTLFKIRKDTDEGKSTVLWNGMQIANIDMSDTKSMKENINQAMDSMRFLKENGLQVFGEKIPAIIDAVNNRPERNGKERINLSDGINPEEQKELLETIGQVLGIETSQKELDSLKKVFHTTSLQSGGLLKKLQQKGYAKNDFIDTFAITNAITKSTKQSV